MVGVEVVQVLLLLQFIRSLGLCFPDPASEIIHGLIVNLEVAQWYTLQLKVVRVFCHLLV